MTPRKLPDATMVALEKRYGRLFEQLADIFSDEIAGAIVWKDIRRDRRW